MSNFPPDSRLAKVVYSPNHDERKRGAQADMLVLHYTGMSSAGDALKRLCDPASKVSSHYLVYEDGAIVQLVPEARRAWHAGQSAWKGERDINARSVGIEIANPGHDVGYPDFSEAQIEAVIALCRDVIARLPIPPDHVLAHSDVAPARKNDPGEKFPWRRFFEHGVGLWVEPLSVRPGPELKAGDRGEAVSDLQRELATFGYDLSVTGRYDDTTRQVVAAFQRHFRPALIDGVADVSTIETLQALLAQRNDLRS
ncbi:MAG: N-acetylmuramoyl-L-alanine amidase [Bradyrhizobiaceae bacterium]|nr:N-acetylmuramoyl-L-alanine amidase [Bradyrhizobiaceae bacterium]